MEFERRIQLNAKKQPLTAGEKASGWHFCPTKKGLLLGPGDEGFPCDCDKRFISTEEKEKLSALALSTRLFATATPADLELSVFMGHVASVALDRGLDPHKVDPKVILDETPPAVAQTLKEAVAEFGQSARIIVGLSLGVLEATHPIAKMSGLTAVSIAESTYKWLPPHLVEAAKAGKILNDPDAMAELMRLAYEQRKKAKEKL